jgi:hypothetical protein
MRAAWTRSWGGLRAYTQHSGFQTFKCSTFLPTARPTRACSRTVADPVGPDNDHQERTQHWGTQLRAAGAVSRVADLIVEHAREVGACGR